MKKRLLIAASILVTSLQFGCGNANQTASNANAASTKPKDLGLSPMKHLIPPEPTGSDDSPILVGSGSFHLRQFDSNVAPLDPYHFSINLKNHEVKTMAFGTCKQNVPVNPGACHWDLTASPTAGMPWMLQLKDTGGSPIATLAFPDPYYPQFILISSYQKLTPEDDNPASGSTQGDGEGYMTPSVTLGGAQLMSNGTTLAQWTCNPSTGMSCTIRIRYCKQGIADTACRS